MSRLTEERLLELLGDPRCPMGIQSRAGQRTRLIGLPDLLAFVEQEIGPYDGLEQDLDDAMTGLALTRLTLTDWWSLPRRALRRLRGQHNPRQVGYEIPAGLAADSW